MAEFTTFDQAVAAHAQWKYRLYQAINTGKSEWTVAQVRTDDQCDLGKWLRSLPMSEQQSERYKVIWALHVEFHTIASEVLEMALAGRKEEAKEAIALGTHFSEITTNLTMGLIAWKEEGA